LSKVKNANYIGGKWRITPRARESQGYEYKDGDWYPKKEKEETQKLFKTQPRKKKNMCGAFPLQTIKNILATASVYVFSAILGISLAFNVFLYMQTKLLEQHNLKLLEVTGEGVIDR
jgi:hypothetical protein